MNYVFLSKRNTAIVLGFLFVLALINFFVMPVAKRFLFPRGFDKEFYETRYQISLPQSAIYQFSASEIWFDSSTRYSVFFCAERPNQLLEEERMLLSPNQKRFDGRLTYLLHPLDIPMKYYFDLAEDHEYGFIEAKKGNNFYNTINLYVLYFPFSQKLILIDDSGQGAITMPILIWIENNMFLSGLKFE